MDYKEQILNVLKEKYPDIKFYFIEENDYFIELLYNDESRAEDDKFAEEIFFLCGKYMTEENWIKLAVVYDYIDRIPK